MKPEEVDAISAATPRQNKTYIISWDFTDAKGKMVEDGIYYCYLEGTLYFNDRVIHSYEIQVGEEVIITKGNTIYTNEESRYKNMLSNIRVSYQQGKANDDEN